MVAHAEMNARNDAALASGPAGMAMFFTIGHSTLAVEDFLALLRSARIERVVDVRRLPGSRRWPQFDRDALEQTLARHGMRYEHVPDLGGRRSRQREIALETNAWWQNSSFHNYADYALLPAFRSAFARVLAQGQRERCVLMCAESLWWRCHRRIITDHLLAAGQRVCHIMGNGLVPATLTPGARVRADGCVVYPALASSDVADS